MIQKMKTHAGSETHTRYVEAELLAKKREKKKGESIAHRLRVGDHESSKN